jgi:hypothetical protein
MLGVVSPLQFMLYLKFLVMFKFELFGFLKIMSKFMLSCNKIIPMICFHHPLNKQIDLMLMNFNTYFLNQE